MQMQYYKYRASPRIHVLNMPGGRFMQHA